MTAILIAIGFFVVVFVIAFLAVLISGEVIDRRNRVEGEEVPASDGFEETSGILREDKVSSISPMAALLERFDFIHIIQHQTMQAGLDWPVGRTAAMMLLCGTLALAILDVSWMPRLLLIGLSAFATLIPYFYILRARRKRFEQFEQQLPEAIDSLCRALKAGHPFAAGMELIASEPYQPVSGEMKKALDEWKLGLTWVQALEALAARVPLTDVEIFVAAVKLHTRTGGRLGEVLGRLSESMRENVAIRGEVRSLAAHGRMTGSILTILPIVLAGILFYVNPMQMIVLISNDMGKDMIIGVVICLFAAHFVIRKIVDIKL